MAEELKASLKKTLIFADFSEDELEAVAKRVTERLLKKGTTVFHEGQPGLAFYIIKTGRVKVYKLAEDGRELILGIFGDSALFGDVPVFDGGPYPAGAAALVDTYVYAINRDDFMSLISDNPHIAIKIVKVLGKRLRQAHGFVVDMALKGAPQKLSALLLRLADEYGVDSEGATLIDIPLTRQEIAEMMGVSRETAIRELSKFKRAGTIKLEGKKIFITDSLKLKQWSRT